MVGSESDLVSDFGLTKAVIMFTERICHRAVVLKSTRLLLRVCLVGEKIWVLVL